METILHGQHPKPNISNNFEELKNCINKVPLFFCHKNGNWGLSNMISKIYYSKYWLEP